MSRSLACSLIAVAFLASDALAKKIKFGVMTDIHMSSKYQPDIAAKPTHCAEGEGAIKTDDVANFGRIGCDPPHWLVSTMCNIMSSQYPDIDVVVLPGDWTGHGVSMDPKKDYDAAT